MSEFTKGKLRVSSDNSNYVHVVKDGKACGLFAACDAGDYARSIEEGNANAAELVRRWNCHDDLVKALEGVQRYNKASEKGQIDPDSGHDYWDSVMSFVDGALAAVSKEN